MTSTVETQHSTGEHLRHMGDIGACELIDGRIHATSGQALSTGASRRWRGYPGGLHAAGCRAVLSRRHAPPELPTNCATWLYPR